MDVCDSPLFDHSVSIHAMALFGAPASDLDFIITMGFGCSIDPGEIYPFDPKKRQRIYHLGQNTEAQVELSHSLELDGWQPRTGPISLTKLRPRHDGQRCIRTGR